MPLQHTMVSTATFTLSSQIEVTNPLTVRVKITNASGQFLDPTNIAADDTRDLTNVTFTRATQTATDFTYKFNVATMIDSNPNYASGSIMVEVVDRAGDDRYQLSDKKTATVAVYRLTTLLIDSASAQVREGEELVYIVTSDFKPPNRTNTLNVSYTVTEEAGTSYIDDSVTTGTSVSDDLVFEFDDTTSDWKARIPILLKDRNNDATDADGTVKIELGTPASDAVYQLADQNRHIATTTIVDNDTPLIKLVGNADNTYATQMANFTIESQIDLDSPITVKIRATNTTGAFLGAGFAADGTMEIQGVTFARTDPTNTALPYVYNLMIPTIADPAADTGVITIELIDDSTENGYNLDSTNAPATVLVYKTVTLLVRAESEKVNEGDTIKIILSGDYKPPNAQNTLNINYSLTEVGTSFLGTTPGPVGPVPLIFTKAEDATDWTSEINIPLRPADTTSSGQGSITFTLTTGDNYTPASGSDIATISVQDTSTPFISIEGPDRITFNGEMLPHLRSDLLPL